MHRFMNINRFFQLTPRSAAVLAALLFNPISPKADVILDWNNATLNAIRATRATPQFASRNLAMVHAAIYDAVNAVDGKHLPYLIQPSASAGTSVEVAAATAAYVVSASLFPTQQGVLSNLWMAGVSAFPEGAGRDHGITLGRAVGEAMLTHRQNDGSTNVVAYTVSNIPGRWRPTPPANAPAQLPHWPTVRPFVLPRGDMFRPAGPVALTSSQWTFEFNQVKSLGDTNSVTRTADQTQIARFWLDGAGTMTPPGHWNLVAQNVAVARGNTVIQNARLFALLNLALADAAIAAWDAKYNTFPFWRPITAIREADTDGNPDTIADPGWTPLVATPPHPDYVSGHSTFSGAAARVLEEFFGGDAVSFTVGSDDLPGVTRSFSGFADCMREIGMSRIYAGIHTLTPCMDGFALGRSVGNVTMRNLLLPVSSLPSIAPLRQTQDGRLESSVTGAAGEEYWVESSSDLQNWQAFARFSGPSTLQIRPSSEQPLKFLRAVRPLQGY